MLLYVSRETIDKQRENHYNRLNRTYIKGYQRGKDF